MADNDFEKRVQQMMGQLKLQPSETVWQNVEAQINKKKRRRWLLLLLLPALGLGGYLLLPKKNAPADGMRTTKNANTNTKKNDEKNSALYQPKKLNDSAVANHEKEKVKSKNEKENSPLIAEDDVRQQQTQQSFLRTQKENEVVTNSEAKKEMIEKTEEKNEIAAYAKQNEENKTAANAEQVSPADSLVIAYNQKAGNAANVIADEPYNAKRKGDTALAENNEQKKADTLQVKKITTAKKPFQLQWGISVFGGKGNTVLNVFNRLSADDKAYMGVSNPLPDSVSGFNPFTQVKAATSFGIGSFVQRNISKRSSISAGINFSYLQTRINAVRHIDSIGIFENAGGLFNLDGYYRPSVYSYQVPYSSTQSVKNTYLLLDLPVTYHYRITNSTKWPLYANAGLSAAFLLHKKALLYDLPNAIYYYGTNQYRTIQLHTTFGFAAQLQVNKKYALQLGPQLRYGLTNITTDKKTYGKQHFLQYGLQANLLFRKK